MARLFYSEIAPPGSLAVNVDCIWTVAVDSGGPGKPQHWVIPDGCWTLSVGVRPVWYVRLRPPATEPFVAPCTGGELIAGIRFRPGSPPPDILREARRTLRAGQSLGEVLSHLLEALKRCGVVRDARLDVMVSNMREKSGQVSMPCIAEGLGMSERHLERLSHQQLGFTPKTFARIARLQAVLRHLIANPETKLVDVASNFGYSDQTHMTRDFTRFGRITPVMYRRSLQHVGFVLDADLPTR